MVKRGQVVPVGKNYDRQINDYILRYSTNKQAIEVSFRDLVQELNKPDRFTHLTHTYPAKLLMHIPHFFLNNNIFSKEGDTILDPFTGSGTVMLEAILAKRHVIGADANPLARLIASVKVNKYKTDDLTLHLNQILKELRNENSATITPNVLNVDYWFLPEIQIQLTTIFNVINKIIDKKTRDFFLVCFSNCVKKVSLADQRVSVPVKLNPERYKPEHPLHLESKKKLSSLCYVDVIEKFNEITKDNIERFKSLEQYLGNTFTARIVSEDARVLTANLGSNELIADSSISLIISSPPYAGAQKYIRASSLSLGWLDMLTSAETLRQLDGVNIGRENYKKSDYQSFKPTDIKAADILLEEIFKIR